MIELKVHTQGCYTAMRDPRYLARMRTITRKAHKLTISKYMRGTKSPTFVDRFDYARGARFQFTRRDPAYERRQARVLGRPRPYYSPTKRGTFGTGHLANMVRLEGRGHRIRAVNTDRTEVRTRMTYPAARILNFLSKRGDGPKYRAEFLRFDHPSHQQDVKLIYEGVAALIVGEQAKAFRAGERRHLRAQRATMAANAAANRALIGESA